MAIPARTNERRAAGWANAPAEFAAWTARPIGHVGERVVESRQLLAVNGSSGSSATARWVNTPASSPPGAVPRSTRRARRRVCGWAPTRCIPVSILRCTGRRSGSARRRARRRSDGCRPSASIGARRSPPPPRAAARDSTRIGASIPAPRSSTPSATSATHSPSAPASSAARATCDRAVSVAVGLHHRPDRRRRRPRHADTRRCARSRRDRPPPTPNDRVVSHPIVADRSAERLRACPGSWSTRSPASRPARGRARAASACTHAAAAAARNGSTPSRASSRSCQPGRRPFRLSPDVDRRVDHQHLAVGVGDHGRRSLQQHRAPSSAASPRTAASRSARGGEPVSSANSPSCGVSTVGRVRRQQRRRRRPRSRRGVHPVTVDDDGQHRVGDQPADRGDVSRDAPEPGPDHERAEPVEVVEHRRRPSRPPRSAAG